MSVSTTPTYPQFFNDTTTTTITTRRIAMQVDPSKAITLGQLQEFVTFALAAGAASSEPVQVALNGVSVARTSTSDTAIGAPTP
ncbi:MAG: hypothetical protein BGO38_06930 [Cellulomonas sp. 73-145]|uniref:hypothetical protein n=1 Tax=Cellulomonas sp. 73-145 TaxID=1895739 RepID=UPI0009261304|nr:hypothetical protein [Cellulomonas sp. 73-145]MBN9328096.1 hypothetical protein [Cellulomonas sp.]OJV57950.1 MAG: hypothetical protein BGO38_06930 [Cellulomonas sp. 73-145]